VPLGRFFSHSISVFPCLCLSTNATYSYSSTCCSFRRINGRILGTFFQSGPQAHSRRTPTAEDWLQFRASICEICVVTGAEFSNTSVSPVSITAQILYTYIHRNTILLKRTGHRNAANFAKCNALWTSGSVGQTQHLYTFVFTLRIVNPVNTDVHLTGYVRLQALPRSQNSPYPLQRVG
jgi:hypothetical protein